MVSIFQKLARSWLAWEKKRLFFSFFTPERKTKIVSYQQLITPFSFVSVLPPLHNATKPVLFFFMMILVFGASILLLWERNQKSVTKLQTRDMASERSEWDQCCQLFKLHFYKGLQTTVWKFHNFSIIQILREIHFLEF